MFCGRPKKTLIPIILLACILVIAGTISSQADVPRMIHYQGYLTDAGGSPVDGTMDLTFAIHSDSSGGTQLWTESKTAVPIANGLFEVLLGSSTPIALWKLILRAVRAQRSSMKI